MNANIRQPWPVIFFLLLTIDSLIVACGTASTRNDGSTPVFVPSTQATPSPGSTTFVSPDISSPPSLRSDFPLALHNTWVYQAIRYQAYPIPETMTTTHLITDTVVDIKIISPYVVATIHRNESAETPIAVPSNMLDILMPAASHDYWLVVNRNRLYRQENKFDLSNLDEALLELVFPLALGANWYQSDLLAKSNPTPQADAFELRKVTRVSAANVPVGHFDTCYFLQEEWAGATFENWYCPAVGWVDKKYDHHGTPEGSHQILISYQLNR